MKKTKVKDVKNIRDVFPDHPWVKKWDEINEAGKKNGWSYLVIQNRFTDKTIMGVFF